MWPSSHVDVSNSEMQKQKRETFQVLNRQMFQHVLKHVNHIFLSTPGEKKTNEDCYCFRKLVLQSTRERPTLLQSLTGRRSLLSRQKYSLLQQLRSNQPRATFPLLFQITLKPPLFEIISVLLNTDENIFPPCLPSPSELSLIRDPFSSS